MSTVGVKRSFNFEGGCYAKCINLAQEHEPVIWDAIRYGSIIENVVLDDDNKPDYTNSSITENIRAVILVLICQTKFYLITVVIQARFSSQL